MYFVLTQVLVVPGTNLNLRLVPVSLYRESRESRTGEETNPNLHYFHR